MTQFVLDIIVYSVFVGAVLAAVSCFAYLTWATITERRLLRRTPGTSAQKTFVVQPRVASGRTAVVGHH